MKGRIVQATDVDERSREVVIANIRSSLRIEAVPDLGPWD